MRRLSDPLAMGAVAMVILGLLAGPAPAQNSSGVTPVDVELVLAVDISMSMDRTEQELQREGYVRGLVDPLVIEAIEQGLHGQIAVAYVEWAGIETQQTVIDWVLVDSEAAARELSGLLAELPIQRARRTSISSGIDFSAKLFDGNGYQGIRRVIDVSGDGPNNQGGRVDIARDRAVAQGIIINGLPFVTNRDGPASLFDLPNLDEYYADCVIGGPGAFSLPIYSSDEFAEAIRNKLVLEIAGLSLPTEGAATPIAVQGPRVPCDIGERQWQRFMGDPS